MCIRLLYLRDEKVDFAEIGSLANVSHSGSDKRVVIYSYLKEGNDSEKFRFVFRSLNPAFDPLPYLNNRFKCSVSTSKSRRLARSWLDHCMARHAHCRTDTEQFNKMPARLIEITFNTYTPTIRVISTSGQNREKRYYMTLSYCWGDVLFTTLRSDNKQQLKRGIKFETLPKVFQDAIHIAGWFQIKYLWVDSSCILQDSHDDWIRESCKMKDIYRNSFLTVAATAASDPSRGCFRDRDPLLVAPIKYRVSLETQKYQTIFNRHDWELAMDSSPLSKRAWAFQERLLSPRVLHFGENQMLWECNEMSACESCPGGIPSNLQKKSSAAAKRRLMGWHGEFMDWHKDFIHGIWAPIVNSYSKSALTKFSDKCLAFSGIADQAQSLCGGTYVAGLWREGLMLQLLWDIEIPYGVVRTDVSYKRPKPNVAPSWFWLSMDGPIAFFLKKDLHVHFEILDINMGFENSNPFGTIMRGEIKARGWLSAGTWQQAEVQTHLEDLQSIGDHLYNDEMTDVVTSERIVCLPVGSDTPYYAEDGKVYGLVLARINKKLNLYCRCGVFNTCKASTRDDTDVRRQLFHQKLVDGEWIDGPKTTFNIV